MEHVKAKGDLRILAGFLIVIVPVINGLSVVPVENGVWQAAPTLAVEIVFDMKNDESFA